MILEMSWFYNTSWGPLQGPVGSPRKAVGAVATGLRREKLHCLQGQGWLLALAGSGFRLFLRISAGLILGLGWLLAKDFG